MEYAIGLDCGITSVGWAVMELNDKEEPQRIIKLGSRIFAAAENPKDGSSLALPRREARGTRRRLRRHKHRLERIRWLIVDEGILGEEQLKCLYDQPVSDIYQLRTDALDRPVSNEEFARILIHVAQRRGFKSNRKVDKEDKDNGKILTAVNENKELMAEKGYRTVGEMMALDEKFSSQKRNKSENYTNTVARDMIEDEAHKIFEAQRNFGKAFASEEIETEYVSILMSQRSFEEGPGGDSKYGGNQIEKMIGKCTFYPEELRAAKATFSFQYFELLQAINHIRLIVDGKTVPLTADQRKIVADLAFKSDSVAYSKIRKSLALLETVTFAGLRYKSEDLEETEKAEKFKHMHAYNDMRKKFDKLGKNHIAAISRDDLDAIGYALTVFKTDDKIIDYLKEHSELSAEDLDAVLAMPSSAKFGHISVKACKALIPDLEQGMTYNEACEAAGLDFKAHSGNQKDMYLPANAPELEDLTNHVVKRAVSQTIKVINAIIREQGKSPAYLNIELAREMAKHHDERVTIEKHNKENNAYNERLKQEIRETYRKSNPTGMDIVKLKLFHEQNEISPYSQKKILSERLFEPGYVDIDHIIPYSISFDDSYKNKVLVFSSENREKGNRIPKQYMSKEQADKFEVWVRNNIKDFRKRQKLLKEKLTEEDLTGFKQRNLNDTQYLNRFLLNFVRDHLEFAETDLDKKKRVRSVNGAVTSYMRKRWGIAKIRENGDLHHAADAAVIACVTDGMINKVSRWSKYHETEYEEHEGGSIAIDPRTGEVLGQFPLPYPEFRKELDARLWDNEEHMHDELRRLANYRSVSIDEIHPCFVSRMPTRKVTGAAHLDTIRSPRHLEEDGIVLIKTPLEKLKLKDNEIADYYKPESDALLYNALKDALIAAGGDGSKAFPKGTEFHKPKADGTEGPVVKKVKTYKKSTMNVALNNGNGVADNGSMVRIDVFYVEGEGYYYVPIYVADTLKPELPSKASVAAKPYDEWKAMKEEDFIFSLYPNDLLCIAKSQGTIKMSLNYKESTLPKAVEKNSELVYYIKAGISVACIAVRNHDNSYKIDNLGIKSLERLEKYQVDVLGNYHKVGKEKRQTFNKK